MRNVSVSLKNGDKKVTIDRSSDLRDHLTGDRSKMGRGDPTNDLRSKLERRKVKDNYARSKWDSESEEESTREVRIRKGKENEKKRTSEKKESRRSQSKSRTRRDRSREARRVSRSRSRSTSTRRRPLSEKVSVKSERSKDGSDRKRKISSEDENSRRTKLKKKSASPSPPPPVKTEKKKKKNKDEDKEKTKKKKKKAKKEKKEESEDEVEEEEVAPKEKKKNKKKKADLPSEVVDKVDVDPKGRKSRVDSGISTGSAVGQGNGDRARSTSKQEEERPPSSCRQVRKVSDSPLSGTSLSPSPPSKTEAIQSQNYRPEYDDKAHETKPLENQPNEELEAKDTANAENANPTGENEDEAPRKKSKGKRKKSKSFTEESPKSDTKEKDDKVERKKKKKASKAERSSSHKEKSRATTSPDARKSSTAKSRSPSHKSGSKEPVEKRSSASKEHREDVNKPRSRERNEADRRDRRERSPDHRLDDRRYARRDRSRDRRDRDGSRRDYYSDRSRNNRDGYDRRHYEQSTSRRDVNGYNDRRDRPADRRDRPAVRRDRSYDRRDRFYSDRRERSLEQRARSPVQREKSREHRGKSKEVQERQENTSPEDKPIESDKLTEESSIDEEKKDTSPARESRESGANEDIESKPDQEAEKEGDSKTEEDLTSADDKANSSQDQSDEVGRRDERRDDTQNDKGDERRSDRYDRRPRSDYRDRRPLSPDRNRPRSPRDRRDYPRDYRGRPRDHRDRHDRNDRRRDYRNRSRERYNDRYDDRYSHRYNPARYDQHYDSRYQLPQLPDAVWNNKIDSFLSWVAIDKTHTNETPTLHEESAYSSYNSSLSYINPSAEHMPNYSNNLYPRMDGVEGQTGLPYPVAAANLEPTITRGPSYSPTYPDGSQMHTAVCVDESFERSSKERDNKPLTVKEKKRMELAQKDIWQYVASRLMTDSVFLRRRKKIGETGEDDEDLKEKAEKCAVRIAQKLEKGGFKEARLWVLLKDNEKGVEGFMDEMKVAIMSGHIEIDRESKKPKEKLDAELLTQGIVFRYIGEYIEQSLHGGKARMPSSKEVSPVSRQPSNLAVSPSKAEVPSPVPADDPRIQREGESSYEFAVRSFRDLQKFISVQLTHTLKLDVDKAQETASLYITTLALADFNLESLGDRIRNYTPPAPEFEGEPEQTVYGYLLETLRAMPFDKYPRQLADNNLDTHQTNIVRICLEYFTQSARPKSASSPPPASFVRTVGEEEDGFIGPTLPTEVIPVGGNTENQLPQRRYIFMSVSVDTICIEGRPVVWQLSVHIPGLPEDEDPDYECLMLPAALESYPQMLGDLGFTYDPDRRVYYHQGPEFGRRKAESEEISLEKFTNYLNEIRSGLRGAGKNNGLVLLFETGEDLYLVRQLLAKHRHDLFLDVVRGLTCIDHYLKLSKPGRPASYTWPVYQHKVGDGGRWTSSVTFNSANIKKIEAITKPECVYKICEGLLGTVPSYNNFIKWFCYPINHPEVSNMTVSMEHILELLPVQNFIDRQLFTNRVELKLEGAFAARSEVEATRPYNACARQTIRRLVALGFSLEVLKKSFRSDPAFQIPSSVFLQDLTEVQKLRLHEQTDQIRGIIKQYFHNKP